MGELPREVQVIDTPDGVRYVFPTRDLGWWRLLALPMLLFAMAFAGMPISWAIDLYRSGGPVVMAILFAGFGLFGGLPVAIVAMYIFAGHSEVVLRNDQLIAIERWGLFRKRWTRPLAEVDALAVGLSRDVPQSEEDLGAISVPGLHRPRSVMVTLRGAEKPMFMGPGYPHDWLAAVAQDLAWRCERQMARGRELPVMIGRGSASLNDVKEKLTGSTAPTADEGLLPQPSSSTASVDDRPGELNITLPPMGLWRGSKGLFVFALFWNGFMCVFTPVWFLGSGGPKGWEMVFVVLFLLLFWGIGIGILLSAINLGRRRAIIDVIGDTLLITQRSVFGTKQHEFRADELHAIRVGESGTSVNDKALMCLHVQPVEGKLIKLFTERDDAELRWLASLLRSRLHEVGWQRDVQLQHEVAQ